MKIIRGKDGKFLKGTIPFTKWKKGIHLSPNTEFKKGQNLKEKNHNWKGGRHKTERGYIYIYMPQHPRSIFGKRYVAEHILVAEKKIDRPLRSFEQVHHINGIKDDNRPENIIILTINEHARLHSFSKKYKRDFDLTKEFLEKEYIRNKKTLDMIAQEVKCSKGIIKIRLKEFGIKKIIKS